MAVLNVVGLVHGRNRGEALFIERRTVSLLETALDYCSGNFGDVAEQRRLRRDQELLAEPSTASREASPLDGSRRSWSPRISQVTLKPVRSSRLASVVRRRLFRTRTGDRRRHDYRRGVSGDRRVTFHRADGSPTGGPERGIDRVDAGVDVVAAADRDVVAPDEARRRLSMVAVSAGSPKVRRSSGCGPRPPGRSRRPRFSGGPRCCADPWGAGSRRGSSACPPPPRAAASISGSRGHRRPRASP